jgi:hypothetical protein
MIVHKEHLRLGGRIAPDEKIWYDRVAAIRKKQSKKEEARG